LPAKRFGGRDTASTAMTRAGVFAWQHRPSIVFLDNAMVLSRACRWLRRPRREPV